MGQYVPSYARWTVWVRRVPRVNKWSNRTEELSSLSLPPPISATIVMVWLGSTYSIVVIGINILYLNDKDQHIMLMYPWSTYFIAGLPLTWKPGNVREEKYGQGKSGNFIFLLKVREVREFYFKCQLPWNAVILVDYWECLSQYSPIWMCTCEFAKQMFFFIVFKCSVLAALKRIQISYGMSYFRLSLGFSV